MENLEPRLHLSRGAATGLVHSAAYLVPVDSVAQAFPATSRAPALVRPAVTIHHATDLSNSITGNASDGKLTIPYRLFLPQLATPAQKVPLILYLHGMGDGGTDNVTQAYWMSNLRTNTAAGPYAAYILAPQNKLGAAWYSPGKQPLEIETLVMSLVKQTLLHQPNIDPTRVYITGPSSGALGVWDLMQRNPRFFAAGVPMSGALNATIAPRLKSIPIWAFHGADDVGVSPAFTRALITAIVKAGGTPWYTEIPGGGHFIWDQVYAMPELYAWIFTQHLAHKGK